MAKKKVAKTVKSASKKKAVKTTAKKVIKKAAKKAAKKKVAAKKITSKKVVAKKIASKKISSKKVAPKKALKKIVKKTAAKPVKKAVKKTAKKIAKKKIVKAIKKIAKKISVKAAKKVVKKATVKAVKKVIKKAPLKSAVKKIVAKVVKKAIAPKPARPTIAGIKAAGEKRVTTSEQKVAAAIIATQPTPKTISKVELKPIFTTVAKDGVTNDAQKLSDAVINGILEVKGKNVSFLDLTGIQNRVCDYFIICQADSTTQVNAIADSVIDTVKKTTGERPYHSEGFENSEWILVDYVNVVVHVFQSHIREFYNLESLWADAEETKIAFD